MAKKRMGFEGLLLWGSTGGTTAATELTEARDVSYVLENVEADISDRSSIINLMDVAGLNFSLEFEVNNKDASAFVSAARAQSIIGGGLPLLTADKAGGWGVDADFIIGLDESQALRDAQRIKISAKPTDKYGRLPSWGTQSSTTTTTAGP